MSNQMRYQDFRLNYPLILVGLILEVVCVHSILSSGVAFVNVFVLVIAFLLGMLFISCSIAVDTEFILISYGIGIFKVEKQLHDIVGYDIMKNYNLFAWMYNPIGMGALKITFRDGDALYLPTNDPKKLQQATQRERR